MSPVHPDILAALTAGIQSEIASYVFYVEAAKKSETAKIKNVLEQLAGEEKNHFHILERQHDSLVRSEKWVSTADILKREGLPEITEEMTREHRGLVDSVRAADSIDRVLEIAFGLEEEAYNLFASEAAKGIAPEAKEIFEKLARFEKSHMKLIEQMRSGVA